MTEDTAISVPAIRRQVDVTDLTGVPRRAWEFDHQGQLYYLAEGAKEPTMLVKKGPAQWEYVPPEQRDQVLDAFRAEWAKGNRIDRREGAHQAGGNDKNL